MTHNSVADLKSQMSFPVIGAPLYSISNPELVIAQCTSGIVGAFPALNARPAGELDVWITQIKEALDAHNQAHPDRPAAPYAVNQIVHRSNDRFEQDLEVCARHEVPLIITSMGAREEVNTAAHSWGGMTLHDVTNNTYAHKAIEKGADGLIAVAAGAGGHSGNQSPFALVQEIRSWFDGPLALSGSIATGRSIAAALTLGADFAYIGSPFIATHEASASPSYKEMIRDSRAEDIFLTAALSGVPANYLRPSLEQNGYDMDALIGAVGKGVSVTEGEGEAKLWLDIWSAGQGVGAVKSIVSVAELVSNLKAEWNAVRKSQRAFNQSGSQGASQGGFGNE